MNPSSALSTRSRLRGLPALPALFALFAVCCLALLLPGLSRAQTLDANFNPNANGLVNAITAVGNHYWVGGWFSNIGGQTRNYLARLDASGNDTGIDLGLNGNVNVIRHDAANNHLYVGGWFTEVAGSARPYLLRLDATTGALDTTFQPLQGVAADGRVFDVLVDGAHVLIGGSFVGDGSANALPDRLVRLNRADGTPDTDFNDNLPALNNMVLSLLRQADGKLLVGGLFTDVDVSAAQDGSDLRGYLIRLNADGSPDPGFHDAQLNGSVYSLVPGNNGSFYAAGGFTTMGNNNDPQTRVAQFNTDGNPVAAFANPDIDLVVWALARQADGKLLIGGAFTTVGGETRNRLARLEANGALDTSLGDMGLDGPIYLHGGLLPLPGGRLLIGGGFTTVLTETRNRIALLNLPVRAPASAVPVPVNAPLMLVLLAGLLGFAAQRSRKARR